MLWWLALSSVVQAIDTAYLLLRPHSLPNGYFHRYFVVYDVYLIYDPTYADTNDPFTRALAIVESAQIALNTTTLLLVLKLPRNSAWPSLLAVSTSAATLAVTAYFFLYEALSGGVHKYRLVDVSTWDVGYALGYVGVTALWIVFPLAVIAIVGGQLVRAAERTKKVKKS